MFNSQRPLSYRNSLDAGVGSAVLDKPRAPVEVRDVFAGTDYARLPPESLPGSLFDVSIEEWDTLLCSVKARLALSSGERVGAQRGGPQVHDASGEVRAGVLECVEALDQLHTMLTRERAQHQRLEVEVFEAQCALRQALADIVGNDPQYTAPAMDHGGPRLVR